MTLSLLKLYNAAATQEWAMYDNDALSDEEFEPSLVLALNKAVYDILYNYPFGFRERTHLILTLPNENEYPFPEGIIKQDKEKNYQVRNGLEYLHLIENPESLEEKSGMPEGFYIKGENIVFYPTPEEKGLITIEYYTLAVGENKDGDEIFILENEDDVLSVPIYLEELFKNAVITQAMLNSIAAEKDENYSAYKKQAQNAYKLLIKYSKGVGLEKNIKI